MLQRNPSILWRELDGEAVLLSPSAGSSYNLNQVGAFIWKMLDGKHTSENIAAAICQVYEVEYEQALQDVENILLEMLNNNLLNESLAPQVIG
ncbi:MAG TPA: PqqD family protein [Ktedonobacteraceae bacterium]|nr:PqqD family protein [Ktedonobacteraceae bacterium]